MCIRLLALAAMCFQLPGQLAGQDEVPQLATVFGDDFGTDTRSDYTITGDVSWERGRLTLGKNASLEREVGRAVRLNVDLHLQPSSVAPQQSNSDLCVWFKLDSGLQCFVRLRRQMHGGQPKASAALVRLIEEDGDKTHDVVRESTMAPHARRLLLVYDQGVVRVTAENDPVLVAFIGHSGELVRAVAVQTTATMSLQSFAVRAHSPPEQSDGDKEKLAAAAAAEDEAAQFQIAGKFGDAARVFETVLEIRQSVLGDEHPECARALSNLARAYWRMGDAARAEALHKQELDVIRSVLGEQHPDYARGLNNLAAVYSYTGRLARAEPLYKQALEIDKTVLGEQSSSYGVALNNMGHLRNAQGDTAGALPYFEQAVAIHKSLYGEHHPEYVGVLHNLAFGYRNTGNYARAESLFKEVVESRKALLGDQHTFYAGSVLNLAGVYWRMGDFARAEPLYREAQEIQRRHIDTNAALQSARQQSQNQLFLRNFLDNRLTNATEMNSPAAELVAADLWKWKGSVTARQQAYRKVAAHPELAPLFTNFQSITRQLASESGDLPIPPPASAAGSQHTAYAQQRQDWEQRVARLTRQREDIEQKIAAGSLEFRRTTEPLTAGTVQSLLPEATALIDFLEYGHHSHHPTMTGRTVKQRRYLAVIVPNEGAVRLVELGPADAVADAITGFRRPLAGEKGTEEQAEAAARKLRELLWLPLEEHLINIKTVIISPDTALGRLPFAALPGAADGSYLIEDYRFTSLPLAGMLRPLFDESVERPQPEMGLFVLGDVDYDANAPVAKVAAKQKTRPAWMRSAPRAGDASWQSLPGFQQELAIVRDQFEKKFGGGVTTLRGAKATEAEFIRQASRHYNLHVITHGFFADPQYDSVASSPAGRGAPQLGGNQTVNQYMPGLLSGIVLAGANNPPPADEPQADGILTASEIETLDLNAVDLVVLSACQTGLGKTAGGEGLTGLQRAFHIAGARSCIATLWEVDDKATQELMSRFYRYYWQEGQSRIDALRHAQLDIMNNAALVRGAPVNRDNAAADAEDKSQRTDPRYWAAFVLSGDWR